HAWHCLTSRYPSIHTRPYSHLPGDYTLTARVTDNGAPALNDSKTFTIHVNEVNLKPVLAAITDKSVNELVLLQFTATATDADLPDRMSTYLNSTNSSIASAIFC